MEGFKEPGFLRVLLDTAPGRQVCTCKYPGGQTYR